MINKKIVIISAIIAILVVALAIGMEIKQYSGKNYTFSIVNSKENIKVSENNTKQQEETNTLEEKNEVEENTVNENKTENNAENKDIKLTGEEQAKSLVEKEWGKDDDVYFYLEEKVSDDVYIISVRSKDTTKGLMDYKVNIKTGEISEY